MKRAAAAVLAFAAFAAAVLRGKPAPERQAQPGGYGAPSAEGEGQAQPQDAPAASLWDYASQALGEAVAPAQMPAQATAQQERNIRAALQMLRAAEGTAKDGGYGALFGWPRSDRSFDPQSVSDHPRQFFPYTDLSGKTVKTSASGAYQITWTTWEDNRRKFQAWCANTGYSSNGFLPETQDAFAIYLMKIDGALDHVRAGRLGAAMPILARRWASLPGYSRDANPERTEKFVLSAFTGAGGVLA